jgi:FkbM family methyltransferase
MNPKNLYRRLSRAALNLSTKVKNDGCGNAERERLARLPRYIETTTPLPGFTMKIPDGPSFLAMWKDVFENNIYEFPKTSSTPRILDCGANIGVSCLFFKRLFPSARLTAFEPDPVIFSYLTHNLKEAGIHDAQLIQKALWSSETLLQFHSEGADAGRIASDIQPGSNLNAGQVRTTRLYDYLNEQIDFLKLDIEGAETEVLEDAAPRLGNVSRLFVEYHSFSDKPQTLSRLLGILSDAGFRVQLQPMKYSAKPFLKVEAYLGMDLQLNIFAYRDHLSVANGCSNVS